MPPTLITRSLGRARAHFLAEHGEIVVKPLHGNAGKAVFKVGRDGANLAALIELFNTAWREPYIVQAFLPAVAEGDKRIVLVDGEVAGAVNRRPGEGEIRSNLAVGGTAEKTELTDARGGNLRRDRPGAQGARPAVRRHRRDRRRMADRDQRHLADRHRRHRQVQRHRHARRSSGTRSKRKVAAPMSDWIIRLIEQSGYLGVGFLMFLETVFPPIPSEVIMPVAGVARRPGQAQLWPASSRRAPPARCSAISSGISPPARSASSGWSRSSAAGAAG